jgi:peptidoglycan/LPS O-acetylase OafA/YrhL
MRAFALEDNLRSLWHRRADAMKPIDGLRAIAILWVIAYHTFAFVGRPMRHGIHEPLFRIVNRGLLGVDVFFVLSGFLIGRLLIAEQDDRNTISLRRFYVRRAMRILPAYWVSLAVFCLLVETNASSAWANLLFVNNFLPEDRQCMPWTWSLAVEEQFYIVFPLALLCGSFLRRERRLGLIVGLFVTAVLARALIVQHHGLHVPDPEHARRYYDALYDKPHARAPQLLSGVIVAWLVRFTRAANVLAGSPAWSVAGTLLSLLVVLGMSVVEQPIFVYGWPPALSFAFYVLGPVAFSMAIGFLIFVTIGGLRGGGLLGRALSWRVLYPVSQLSYSAYLIHMIVITVGLEVGPFRPAHSVATMCAYLVVIPIVTLVAAAPLYLLVEKPFMNLRKSASP